MVTPSRLFVLVPVYNEQGTVEGVLTQLDSLDSAVAEVVVVDDGSSDGSSAIIDRWAKTHQNVAVFRHETNRGYSQALLTGFTYLVRRLERGELLSHDVVATIDADGQHDPLELPRLWQTMEADKLDVVWAQRDFSLYPRWKRLGNRLMSLISWVFSGYRFKDVESGYCLFRIGALATALKYRTRDWRYSISLTLAVILTRLGFRLSNDLKVPIPLYRSRTRILDVFTDTFAAANAWAAVTFYPLRHGWGARCRLGIGLVTVMGMGLVVLLVATKPIFLGHDSINNYVHVWFISESLFQHGAIPYRMPWLEGGQALTYPYAFLPWTLAALLHPAVGDFAVTWTMVLGTLLLVGVVYRTRLQSDSWLLVLFLFHPIFLHAILSFQLPFVWGALFTYLYIHALERNSRWWALLWWVLALSTHLLVVGVLLGVYNLWVWLFQRDRRRTLLVVALLSLPLLVPLAWHTLQAPSLGIISPWSLFLAALATVSARASLFFSPFLFVKAKQFFSRPIPGVSMAACFVIISVGTIGPLSGFDGILGGFRALVTPADNPYKEFLESPSFAPGATYRILEVSDREQGHYYFVRHGAVLSHELFSESQTRIRFEPSQYECFLSAKRIDYVVINRSYHKWFPDSEEKNLEALVAAGASRLTYADPNGIFMVFDARQIRQEHSVKIRRCLEG